VLGALNARISGQLVNTKSGFIEEKEKLFSSNSGWLFFISKILGFI
jgi:hypothetical protein